MAQSVEHVIGNDEVISSILITSSKRKARTSSVLFLLVLNKMKKNCTPCAAQPHKRVVLREGDVEKRLPYKRW